MKLHFSDEWIEKHLSGDAPDLECDVGSIERLEEIVEEQRLIEDEKTKLLIEAMKHDDVDPDTRERAVRAGNRLKELIDQERKLQSPTD